MRNRFILLTIILGIWLGLKLIDEDVTDPDALYMLAGAVAIMIAHSVWLMTAQGRWHRKNRKARLFQANNQAQAVPAELTEQPWEPWIDIVIAAKNEQRVIESTVRNFFKLNYEKFHIWVVDDQSTDATKEILSRLQEDFPRLRVLRRRYGSCPGKSAALNDALPLCKGEVIAVFDADAYVDPDFFNKTLPLLQPDGIAAVQAQKRIFEDQTGFLVQCQGSEYALDTYFQTGRDLIGGAVELRGNGEVIKRQALIDVGGWNNKSVTDDLDLSMRFLINKWDVRFCPHAHVFEEGVPKLNGLLRQRRRWAEGAIQRYLDYIFPLNSPTRLSFVERLDTFAFTVYFIVPALIFLETTSELTRLSMGVPTYGKFFALLTFAVFFVSQLNFCIAIRIYRRMSVWDSFIHSFEVCAYTYGHWVPVILVSFMRILLGLQPSAWKPTEHGHSIVSEGQSS